MLMPNMTEATLIQQIYEAFKGTKLEEGIGLFEADCIDDHLTPTHPDYIHWKQKDERHEWEKLVPLFLSNTVIERLNSSNYFFMDAKGKRFHMPCYLLQDLDSSLGANNPVVTDIRLNSNGLGDYKILNPSQKQTLTDFLEFQLEKFMREENEIDFELYIEAKNIFLSI